MFGQGARLKNSSIPNNLSGVALRGVLTLTTDGHNGAAGAFVKHANELFPSLTPREFALYQVYLDYLLRHTLFKRLGNKPSVTLLEELAEEIYPDFNRVGRNVTLKVLTDLFRTVWDLAPPEEVVKGNEFVSMVPVALGALWSEPLAALRAALPDLAATYRASETDLLQRIPILKT